MINVLNHEQEMASSSLSDSPKLAGPVIDPAILAGARSPLEGWKPPRRFLFGLGPPFEPHPWECDDSDSESQLMELETATTEGMEQSWT